MATGRLAWRQRGCLGAFPSDLPRDKRGSMVERRGGACNLARRVCAPLEVSCCWKVLGDVCKELQGRHARNSPPHRETQATKKNTCHLWSVVTGGGPGRCLPSVARKTRAAFPDALANTTARNARREKKTSQLCPTFCLGLPYSGRAEMFGQAGIAPPRPTQHHHPTPPRVIQINA